jgi:hypothetical protein
VLLYYAKRSLIMDEAAVQTRFFLALGNFT